MQHVHTCFKIYGILCLGLGYLEIEWSEDYSIRNREAMIENGSPFGVVGKWRIDWKMAELYLGVFYVYMFVCVHMCVCLSVCVCICIN